MVVMNIIIIIIISVVGKDSLVVIANFSQLMAEKIEEPVSHVRV